MNPAISRIRRAKSHGNMHSHDERACSSNHAGSCQVNLSEDERQYSMLGGGVLAAYGLMRGSLTGLALAAIGGALLYRGYTGHCQLYEYLGHSSAQDEDSVSNHEVDDQRAAHAAL